MMRKTPILLTLALFLGGCPSDDVNDTGGVEPDFPADYESSYTEVRNCRGSGDHDLNNIRILASPSALEPYQNRAIPFPEDSVVIKEEYDFADLTCEGPIKQWTVMRRLPDSQSSENLGWAWQRVDVDRKVVDQDASRCIGCHTACGQAPDGYEGTCALP